MIKKNILVSNTSMLLQTTFAVEANLAEGKFSLVHEYKYKE
jgi:hypothetical protein